MSKRKNDMENVKEIRANIITTLLQLDGEWREVKDDNDREMRTISSYYVVLNWNLGYML